jgi:tetratricopeptide (TPR) repeat protein
MARAILDGERSAKANRAALALLDKALAIDQDWVPALLGYATVMLIDVGEGWVRPPERTGRLDQAKAAAERAIRLQPANYLAHQALGDILRMRGDPEGALAALARALALNPNAAWTHAIVGKVKAELGRAEEALGDIETALRISPSEPAIHVWYWWAGFAAAHAGSYEAAARWLEKALQAKPDYRFPVPLLAVAYAETGREDEGRALMATYLERAPHLTIATLKRDFPARNAIVVQQREQMVSAFRLLGVPEATRTGSTR